jgi:hypothetical protein
MYTQPPIVFDVYNFVVMLLEEFWKLDMLFKSLFMSLYNWCDE